MGHEEHTAASEGGILTVEIRANGTLQVRIGGPTSETQKAAIATIKAAMAKGTTPRVEMDADTIVVSVEDAG